ncbi:MAG TPA: endonuclease/exonuclease/phosphatase family protein [Acidimicrobiales bacterium]
MIGIALGVLPWSWFLVRDHLGSFGDEVGIGMPALVVPVLGALALSARWLRWRAVVPVMVSWALVFAAVIGGPRLPVAMGEPADPVTLLSANVRYDNLEQDEAALDLLAQDPDVLVVPEATPRIMPSLRPHFEHVVVYEDEDDPDRSYGVAVFSHLPLRDLRTLDIGNGVIRVRVDGPHPFVLFAAHLSRPVLNPREDAHVTHAENHEEVERLHDAILREDLPVVVAGDLNLSDRTRGYRMLDDDLTDVTRDGWARNTYVGGFYRFFQLRIDHVFASEGWCGDRVDLFGVTGSDHRGIRVDIGPCR